MRHSIPGWICILIFCTVFPAAAADTFPARGFTFVSGFAISGNSEKMARRTAPWFSWEAGQPVVLADRVGGSGDNAAKYLIEKPADGYTILASSLSPYIALNTILGHSPYTIYDFAYINIQWQDRELLATGKDSPYRSFAEVIKKLQSGGAVSVATVRHSPGHLLMRIIEKEAGLPPNRLHLVFCNSDAMARKMALGGQVDMIAVSSMRTEKFVGLLQPLAISAEERDPAWDAPTVQEALAPLGIKVPVVPGVLRGFAVDVEVKKEHPERFAALVQYFKRVAENPDAQQDMKDHHMGMQWLGPEKSEALMLRYWVEIEKYKGLLD